jgi:aldehyde:ferredoxin oxidoreductase
MGRILDVDLTTETISTRDTMRYVDEYIGGRALAARIAWDEIPAGIDAYDAENRIIVATGPFTGTLAPTSGRMVMSSLSPRMVPTSWYTHSTLGGWFGPELKYAGFDGIVIWGAADKPVYLEIVDGSARLMDAADLWGLDAYETQMRLREQVDPAAQAMAIGPAGENRVRFATVQHAEENAAGHSGFGAVWGSKNLKAIVVRGTGRVDVADAGALLREVTDAGSYQLAPLSTYVDDEPGQGRGPVCSQSCRFNCGVARYCRTRDGRTIPTFCIGPIWVSEDSMGLTAYDEAGVRVPAARNYGLEYEGDLHQLCNRLGLDLWFRLVMQPWLIRCTELGVREIRGHAIEPESGAWFEDLMRQIAHREGLGAILADDLARAMDTLEGEVPDELIHLGRELEFNFGFPAHREGRFWDEEPLPFWAISAMLHISTSRDPTIGTHQSSLMLAEFLLADREHALRQFRILSEKVWGYPEALEPTLERKAPVAVWSQDQHMLIDSLTMCDFAFPRLVRPMTGRAEWQVTDDVIGDLDLDRRLFAAVTGREMTRDEMTAVARRGFTLERALLARFGRSRALEEGLAAHFELPCRADGTLVDHDGFMRLMDEYYAERGWDLRHGWPENETLRGLGLEDVVAEMEALRRKAL